MTLKDYLARESLTLSAFAEKIGSSHARTVQRYAEGKQIPDREMMSRVVAATGGAVTPNDFFGVAATSPEAKAA